MKKLLLFAAGLMLTACGDDIVSIDDRGVVFLGIYIYKSYQKTSNSPMPALCYLMHRE